MKFIKFTLLILLSIAFILLCVANRNLVTLSFYPAPYSLEIPLFIFALCCVAAGALVTGFVMNVKMLDNYIEHKKTKLRMRTIENENRSLRNEQEKLLTALPKKI